MPHEIIMWIETFDNTNACRQATTLGNQHLAPKETAETFEERAGQTETENRVYCIMRLQGPLSTLLPPN